MIRRYLQQECQKNRAVISRVKLSNQDMRELSAQMRHNRKTTALVFSHVDLWDEGCRVVSECLVYNETVERLEMSHCNITSLGIDYLLKALRNNGAIVEVDLSSNMICDDGAASVLQFLQKRRECGGKMIHFQLAFNQFLSMHFQQNILNACQGNWNEVDAGDAKPVMSSPVRRRANLPRLARKSRSSPPRRLDFDVGGVPSCKSRNASSTSSPRAPVDLAVVAEAATKRSEGKQEEEESGWIVVDSARNGGFRALRGVCEDEADWVRVEATKPAACK